MHTRSILSAVLGAVALGLAATTAQAAAPLAATPAIRADAGADGLVETATFGWRRHCYWHHGYRHCYRGHHHYWRHHYWGWRHHWRWHHHRRHYHSHY
jgi:hypothetical protein